MFAENQQMPLPLNQSNAVFIAPDADLDRIYARLRGFYELYGTKTQSRIIWVLYLFDFKDKNYN